MPLGIILKMLHSQTLIPRICKSKASTWVNVCMKSYYYLRSKCSNYCSFLLWQTIANRKVTVSIRAHPHCTIYVIILYQMFSIMQCIMLYQFEMDNAILWVCIMKNVILLKPDYLDHRSIYESKIFCIHRMYKDVPIKKVSWPSTHT